MRQALEIFQRIGAAQAGGVTAELDALSGKETRDKPAGREAAARGPDKSAHS
jgi:hypothetical protein